MLDTDDTSASKLESEASLAEGGGAGGVLIVQTRPCCRSQCSPLALSPLPVPPHWQYIPVCHKQGPPERASLSTSAVLVAMTTHKNNIFRVMSAQSELQQLP